MNNKSPTLDSIPVIDLGLLQSKNGLAVVVEQFHSAYSQLGFGAIVNHGIDPEIVASIFGASKAFHDQPLNEKMKTALDENHRGYIPINTSTDVNSTLAEVTKPNQSESFMMMREDATGSHPVLSGAYLAGANQWPELDGFKDSVVAYNSALSALGHKIMEIACQAIGVQPHKVLPSFDCPTTWLRLLHYPAQDPQSPDDLFGSAPHTDFGAITLLAQNNVAGLQVKSPQDHWIDCPVVENAFIVNVGDMLHRWSNGVLKSTPHRVINRSGQERYSCAFFYDPYVDTVVTPLAECIAAGTSARYESVHYGDFLRAELEAAYQQHQN